VVSYQIYPLGQNPGSLDPLVNVRKMLKSKVALDCKREDSRLAFTYVGGTWSDLALAQEPSVLGRNFFVDTLVAPSQDPYRATGPSQTI